MVAGNQRIEACLIVEPTPEGLQQMTEDNATKKDFIEKIWPAIKEANGHCPRHAQIARSKIPVLDPDMPMLRAAKGTIQHAATLHYMLSKPKHSIQRVI